MFGFSIVKLVAQCLISKLVSSFLDRYRLQYFKRNTHDEDNFLKNFIVIVSIHELQLY